MAILVVWALTVSVPITFLMAGHLLPLPTRAVMPSTVLSGSNEGRWQAVHILVAGCPCSEFVAKYLVQRGLRQDLDEQVWVIGGPATWELPLEKAGFSVQHHEAEQVATQLGIQGGPWLRLISPAGVVAYSGGYAPQRPGRSTDICDLAVWKAVSRGQTVKAYPAFGCAASTWLQHTIDPWGLNFKSSNQNIFEK